MELNQNIIYIAIAVIGLLVFYYLHREVRRTQADVEGLKVFSANVANYMEPVTPLDPPPQVCQAPPPKKEAPAPKKEAPPPKKEVSEEKKDK